MSDRQRRGESQQPPPVSCAHSESSQQVRRLCDKMLYLAGSMLDTLADYRTKSGERITARIGLGCGAVLVGALGSLQPRVHVMGAGMREAVTLEQQGKPGMVHVRHTFLDRLFGQKVQELGMVARELSGWEVDEVRETSITLRRE